MISGAAAGMTAIFGTPTIAGLAAVLLGGATWRSLSLAGLIRAEDAADVTAADRLFVVQQAPHAGFFF